MLCLLLLLQLLRVLLLLLLMIIYTRNVIFLLAYLNYIQKHKKTMPFVG